MQDLHLSSLWPSWILWMCLRESRLPEMLCLKNVLSQNLHFVIFVAFVNCTNVSLQIFAAPPLTTKWVVVVLLIFSNPYHNHSSVESIQILPLSCFCYYIQVHISMRPYECRELWLFFLNKMMPGKLKIVYQRTEKIMWKCTNYSCWSSTYCWKCFLESE